MIAVGERRPARGCDDLQGVDAGRGGGPCRVEAAVRLRDDHGERMCHYVMQLSGDPGALGGRGQLELLLAFDLQPVRSLDQGVEVRPAGAAQAARHPDGEDEPAAHDADDHQVDDGGAGRPVAGQGSAHHRRARDREPEAEQAPRRVPYAAAEYRATKTVRSLGSSVVPPTKWAKAAP